MPSTSRTMRHKGLGAAKSSREDVRDVTVICSTQARIASASGVMLLEYGSKRDFSTSFEFRNRSLFVNRNS